MNGQAVGKYYQNNSTEHISKITELESGRFFLSKKTRSIKSREMVTLNRKKKNPSALRPLGEWERTMLNRLPPDLRQNLEEIRNYEEVALNKFKQDPNLLNLFLKQPGEALARIGIPVDPVIRKLAKVSKPEDIFMQRKISLPSGEKIEPVISIQINGLNEPSRRKPHARK